MEKRISALALSAVAWGLVAPAHAEMTVEVGGRIDAIYTYYDEDNLDMGSGSEFRRARLFAQGNIDND